jgi:Uma2 family endonuclease
MPATLESPLVLHFGSFFAKMDNQAFVEFCGLNPELRLERSAAGDLIIMSPTGGETGNRNFKLAVRFGAWALQDGTGVGFDSSTGFRLPNGADRSPDVAWVRLERWQALSSGERKGFPPLCPDFVVELRSESDSLATLQRKMQEYLDNGLGLGWLIDPQHHKVYLYRPDQAVEVLTNPISLSGEPLLPGFSLLLKDIW